MSQLYEMSMGVLVVSWLSAYIGLSTSLYPFGVGFSSHSGFQFPMLSGKLLDPGFLIVTPQLRYGLFLL